MSNKQNLFICSGHVGKDPVYKSGEFGTMASFSLCTSAGFKKNDDGSYEDKPQWVNVSVKGKRVETYLRPYLKKGSLVTFHGVYQSREYTDKNGQKQSWHEFVVSDSLHFNIERPTGSRDGQGDESPAPVKSTYNTKQPAKVNANELPDDFEDDVPF